MPHLVVTPPNAAAFRFEIGGGIVRIGRAGRNDLAVEDPTVSRVHAEIVRRAEGLFLIDLGGKSGTFINGRKILAPTLLSPGDQIRIGTTVMAFDSEPTTPVELVATPLPSGPATRILAREEVRISEVPTPSPVPEAALPAPSVPAGARLSARAVSALLRALSEADRELVFHRSEAELLERILDLAQRAVNYERGVLMLLENDELASPVVRVPPGETGTTIRICRAILDLVVGKQQSVLTSDAMADARFKGRESVVGQQIRSAMCVPLFNGERVIGLLYADSRLEPDLFGEEELRVLAHLASVAAIKLENARFFKRAMAGETLEVELRRAAAIQKYFLPARGPEIAGYRIAGQSVPCRGVGGDFFDYMTMPEGRFAFDLGDVAGRGLTAALMMSYFHASLRALSGFELSGVEIFTRLNRQICEKIPSNRFVTCFFGILDPGAHRLDYVNAGQDPPFLIPREGEARRLPAIGMPLGLFDSFGYEAGGVSLEPGDLLLCYSDGVTDGVNAAEVMFGEERLLTAVRGAREGSPEEIVAAVTREIEKHHAGAPFEDDVTLLVLKRDG